MSSAASPNIQFAQRVDGCLYLFKFSLGIEVNFSLAPQVATQAFSREKSRL